MKLNEYGKKIKEYYAKTSIQSKAAMWYVICSFIQRGVTLLTTPIFSRLLSTSEYGIFSVYISWQNIVIIFASLNLASGVYLRGIIKYQEDEEEFTASLQSLFTGVFATTFIIYLLFNSYFNKLFELPPSYICCMFADILVSVSFHFWSARQRVLFKYHKLILITIINAIIKPLLGIMAILIYENNISARIFTMTFADVLTFGYFFVTMYVKRGKKVSKKYWKYALKYNLPLIPHYLSQIILSQSDRIMINSISGASYAGIYSLAYSAASVINIMSQAILNSYNPWMYQKIKEKKFEEINTYSINLLIIIAIFNLLLIIAAPELISVFAPKSYHLAIWVIPPVAMSVYFSFMYSLFSNYEFYFEKTSYMMVASVLGAILNIGLNAIYISKYGFIAAAYTTLICYLCYCLAHYFMMQKIIKKELKLPRVYNNHLIILISILFVLLGFLFMCFYEHTLLRYILAGILILLLIFKRNRITKLFKCITHNN